MIVTTLRAGTTGIVIQGENDGDALIWHAASGTWRTGAGAAGPLTTVASGVVNVPAFGAATVGPFARVAGTVLLPVVQPEASDVGATWAQGDGATDFSYRFRNPGPAVDSDPELAISNATGTPRDVRWLVLRGLAP